jgi:hypothetical protein
MRIVENDESSRIAALAGIKKCGVMMAANKARGEASQDVLIVRTGEGQLSRGVWIDG